MLKKADFAKKIIKILSEKPAVAIGDLNLHFSPPAKGEMPTGRGGLSSNPSQPPLIRGGKNPYAITRSIKGLREAGLVEIMEGGQGDFARLTKEGKKKAHSLKLEGDGAVLNTSWDGFWRIIILDLPEERKAEREALRYLLKKAGFICVKNSVWISMYPYEHLFANIKKDLELSTELIILVTNKLDEDTEKEFLKLIQK